jgi:hypothetical protein
VTKFVFAEIRAYSGAPGISGAPKNRTEFSKNFAPLRESHGALLRLCLDVISGHAYIIRRIKLTALAAKRNKKNWPLN